MPMFFIVTVFFFFALSTNEVSSSVDKPFAYFPFTKEFQFRDVSGNNFYARPPNSYSNNIQPGVGPFNEPDTALHFGSNDDSSSYVSVTDSRLRLGTSSWTLAMLVKNVGVKRAPLLEYLNGLTLWFYEDASHLYINTKSCGTWTLRCPSADDEWRFIAASYDNSSQTIKIYCDGSASEAFSCKREARTSTAELYIGKRPETTADLNPGAVLNGYVSCVSLHLESLTQIDQQALKLMCSESFSATCTYRQNFPVTIPSTFVDAKGHFPLEIAAKAPTACFDKSKHHLCTFYDADAVGHSTRPRRVFGTVSATRKAVHCMVPYLYGTTGRMKVQLSVVSNSWREWINATTVDGDFSAVFNDSAWDIDRNAAPQFVTVGLDTAPQVTAQLLYRGFDTAYFNLTWKANWFSQQLPSLFPMSDWSWIGTTDGDHVDIALLWYNLTANKWQIYSVMRDVNNTGSYYAFPVNNTAKMPREIATSFYTFRISKSVNWDNVLYKLKYAATGTKLPPWYYELSADYYREHADDLCFDLWFLPVDVFQDACKFTFLAEYSGQLAPLVPKNEAFEGCLIYLQNKTVTTADEADCPLKLEQARNDKRFIEVDNAYYASKFQMPGVIMCKISVDANGFSRLILYDRQSGRSIASTLVSGTPWSMKVNGTTTAPAKSVYNFYEEDLLNWAYCCSWNIESENCHKYQDLQSEKPCANYTEPGISTGTGDPHFTSLDGLYFNFNPVGEFWIMKSASDKPQHRTFALQGRMAALWPWVNVTGFTAFAMQAGPNSSIVQVEVPQTSATGAHQADVLVDGQLLDFSDPRLKTQSFPGAVVTADLPNLASITVSLVSDVSFTVTSGGYFLNVLAMPGFSHRANLVGIMGNFDGNKSNDLMAPNGNLAPYNDEAIHYQFGMLWNVSKEDSLFTYHDGKTWESYQDPSFKPHLTTFNPDTVSQAAKDVCGTNVACLFDHDVGNDAHLANQTLKAENAAANAKASLSQVVLSCKSVTRPENGMFSAPNGFFVKSTVQFNCANDFWLNGSSTATCLESLTWDQSSPRCQTIYCPRLLAPENGAMNQTNGTLIGSQVSFACNRGFNLTGANNAANISCLQDSTWSASPPICVQITCPWLQQPANGSVTLSNSNLYESIATYQCGDSQCSGTSSALFYLEGPSTLSCGIDGHWNHMPTSKCLKQCPAIPKSDYMEINTTTITDGKVLRIGSSVTFKCAYSNWTMLGSPTITCLGDSTWSRSPICYPKHSCPNRGASIISAPSLPRCMIIIVAWLFLNFQY